MFPAARRHDLVTRHIPGELLIYDLTRHKAFCLNETSALIWKKCNGKRSVAELAAELQKHYRLPVDERVVWLALDQLEKSRLLKVDAGRPSSLAQVSRRHLIRAGIVTAITLPVITMIAAPTAQAAASAITSAVCKNRRQSDPGGCGGAGGTMCSDIAGTMCLPSGVNKCKCA